MKSKSTKQVVEELLRDDPRCRKDDKWLIIQTLKKLGFSFYIDYRDIEDIPAFETITKCRRKIQNEENKYHADGDEFIPEENVTYEKKINQ